MSVTGWGGGRRTTGIWGGGEMKSMMYNYECVWEGGVSNNSIFIYYVLYLLGGNGTTQP